MDNTEISKKILNRTLVSQERMPTIDKLGLWNQKTSEQ